MLVLDNLLKKSPSQIFYIFCGCHLVVWTVLPSFIIQNATIDIAESIVWGREWQFGYAKHPPLSIWLINLFYSIGGERLWLVFLLSQICVVAAMWAIWKLSSEFFEPKKALCAALLLEGVYYYNFTAFEFNQNVLQLAFWAFCSLYFYKAVKENKLFYWLFLGVCSGLAVMTKYFSGILLLMMLALMIFTREGRSRFLGVGPYLSFAVLLLISLPHLVWLAEHDYMTIKYIVKRTEDFTGGWGHLLNPGRFVYSQFLAIGVAIIAFLSIKKARLFKKIKIDTSFESLYPWVVGIGPFIFLLLLSLIFNIRLRSMWGAPIWGFVGIILFLIFDVKFTQNIYRRFIKNIIVVALLFVLLFFGAYFVAPYYGVKMAGDYPGQKLAKFFTEVWRKETGKPLKIVAGLIKPIGSIALYSEDKPKVITNMRLDHAPWVTEEDIKKHGMLIVWEHKHEHKPISREWASRYGGFKLYESGYPIQWGHESIDETMNFTWAILPPEEN